MTIDLISLRLIALYCAALAGTGVIWGYYALLVEPKAYMLFVVSLALTASNGWNVYRKWQYSLFFVFILHFLLFLFLILLSHPFLVFRFIASRL